MAKVQTKRSSTNVQDLSISPMAADFPISVEDDLPGFDTTRRASYIETRSIPTTPSILSQNSSSAGLNSQPRSNSHPSLNYGADISSVQVPDTGRRYPQTKKRRTPRVLKSDDPQEWFLRAGAAISSEARESKGQSWLANRASSTSLTPAVRNDDYAPSPPLSSASTPRASRAASRQPSRAPSTRGSRVELVTPYGIRTPGQESPDGPRGRRKGGSGYFGSFEHERDLDASAVEQDDDYYDEYAQGPDFVDLDEAIAQDEEDEDEEMSRLTKQRGLGLGGLVDRFFGLSLFAVEEENEAEGGSRAVVPGITPLTPPRNELAKKVGQIVEKPPPTKQQQEQDEQEVSAIREEATAWQDAAWLVRVAARSFL